MIQVLCPWTRKYARRSFDNDSDIYFGTWHSIWSLCTSRTTIVNTLKPWTEHTLYNEMASEGHLTLDNHLHPTHQDPELPLAVISHNVNNDHNAVTAWYWHPRTEGSIPFDLKGSLANQLQCPSTRAVPGVAFEVLVMPRHRVFLPWCSWSLPSTWLAPKCHSPLSRYWMPGR